MDISRAEVEENHKRYVERQEIFKKFGYDVEAERDFIIERSRPFSGNILEVGTGKGYFAISLAKKGYSLTTIDVSEEEHRAARLNVEYFGLSNKVALRVEDAEKMSFKDRSFDTIFSVNVIHHLANPLKVIDEISRLITRDGKMIISDFTREGFETMDRLHASEGNTHATGNATPDEVAEHLSMRFDIERHKSRFQDIIVARHKAA
ncbi:MAG: class I SAM-dependent methyltransferase [Candidatus Omnitrophica bacterium]|nr:class I SAM-dependent methyltransferase [Candidatus Omnitrophota bacterium]MDD5736944.1 class I SAM-dependent methyltransferase [Candidatus Omnitrophota bacterium]